MAPASSIIAKLKVQLKLSIARLRMVQQKDEAVSKQQRRAMAALLEAGKVESAKIRVENIIRSDITTELHEILELYCELLLARTGLMEAQTCDPGLEEAVKSLIYAAPRTDVKELQNVRNLLVEKYGKEFAMEVIENSDSKVSEKVLKKLTVTPPAQELVNGYLEEIARTYGVDWPKKPKEELDDPPDYLDDDDEDENPSGGQAQKNLEAPLASDSGKAREEREALSRATPPRNFGPQSPLRVNPPSPSTDNLHPRVKGTLDLKPTKKMQDIRTGKGTQSKGPVGGTIPDVDELSKRFAALKK
ncbi:probable IST1 Putative translation initiation factor, has a role in resistance to high concentrations of sodium [Rhynchosporium agropyri]|uniref:Probable IST1 Putative translation initiation factor, has a role in resistance to high concentrations of sodium n=1 Tax=Rhynchosporium agropyri TaxID=914238 RepID=A0A1E1KGM0_9HELO|nr:probable IST1 Putative translation initiation factor, has a role in resistance to high concentrations of sodium [Rhynchosporium agropyri]